MSATNGRHGRGRPPEKYSIPPNIRVSRRRVSELTACTDLPDLHAGVGHTGRQGPAPDRRECARSPRPHVSLSVTAGKVRTHRAAGTAPAGSTATFTGVRPPTGTPAFRAGVRLPAPGSPGVRMHPAGSPGPRSPPCAVTLDQLHRQGDGPRAAGTTDGDASAPRQSRKTLSAAIAGVLEHGDYE